MTVVSPQTRAALQLAKRFVVWLLRRNWRAFLGRFASLWLPLLLIWVLPMPREIAQWSLSMFSRGNYDQGYRPLRRALAMPDDLGAHLNALDWTTEGRRNGFFTYTPVDSAPDAPVEPSQKDWLARIESHFKQPWLAPVLFGFRASNSLYQRQQFPDNLNNYDRGSSSSRASRATQFEFLKKQRAEGAALLTLIQDEMKRDPRNAFWVIERARWEWNYAPRPFYPLPKSNFTFAPKINLAALVSLAPSVAPLPPMGAPAAPGDGIPVAPPPMGWGASFDLPLAEWLGPHPQPLLELNDEPVLKQTLAILEKTRSCSFYEDGSFRAVVARMRDVNDAGLNSLEVRLSQTEGLNWGSYNYWCRSLRAEMWGQSESTNRTYLSQSSPVRAALVPRTPLAQRVSKLQLVQWGAAWERIGNLMAQKAGRAESRINQPGFAWVQCGWSLPFAPTIRSRSVVFGWGRSFRVQPFVSIARASGKPILAREALGIEAQFDARDAIWKRANDRRFFLTDGTSEPQMIGGASALVSPLALWSALWCQTLGIVACFLVPLWLFLNIWLINGRGRASSSPARWIPSLVCVSILSVLAVLGLRAASVPNSLLYPVFRTCPLPVYFVFCLAVPLLLWCVLATVMRHHPDLVDREPDRWHTRFLSPNVRPWGEPILLAVSATLVLSCGLLLAHFALSPGTGTAPVGAGIVGINTVRDATVALGSYGLASGALSVLVWIFNWRFSRNKSVWPITHSGLRWWKETIGASICVLAWLYLFVALAAWSARSHAKQMLDERWQSGDWVWLQKNL